MLALSGLSIRLRNILELVSPGAFAATSARLGRRGDEVKRPLQLRWRLF